MIASKDSEHKMLDSSFASAGPVDGLKVKPSRFSVAVRGFVQQIRAFSSAHIEVMRLGIRLPGQWPIAILIWICDFGAVFCEGAVILAIANASAMLGAVNAKDNAAAAQFGTLNGFVEFLAGTIGLSKTTVVMTGSILVSCSLLVGSVILHYGASVQARRFARHLHFWWLRGLMNAAGDPRVVASGLIQHDQTEIRNAVMQWSIHASKAFEVLSRLLQVIVATVSFFVAAFAMNWELMSLLLLLTMAFAPVAAFVARGIHAQADDFYNSGATMMGGEAARVLVESDKYLIPGRSNKLRVDAFVSSNALMRYLDGFDSVQLASANMALMTGLVRAVLFGVGVTLMTAWVVLGKEPVGRIVAFASVLFIALRYLQNCFAYLATLNIYYPQVVRLLALHKRLSPFYEPTETPPSAADNRAEIGQSLTLKAQQGSAVITPGSIVEIVGRFKVTKSDLPNWLPALVKASGSRLKYDEVAFCGGRVTDLARIDLDAVDLGLQRNGLSGLSEFMSRLKLKDEWQAFAEGLPGGTRILDAASLGKIPMPLGTALVFAEMRSSKAVELFADSGLVAQLKDASRDALGDVLGPCRFYVMQTPDRVSLVRPQYILVITQGMLAAVLPPETDKKVLADLCRSDEASKSGYVSLDDTMLFDA